jgi:hypothetical protein
MDLLEGFDMDITSPNAFNILSSQFKISRNQYYHIRRKLIRLTKATDYLKQIQAKGYIVSY